MLPRIDRQIWIFGIVERQSREVKLFILDDRNQHTLTGLLGRHLEVGTFVNHDGWKGYNRQRLRNLGLFPRRHIHRQNGNLIRFRGTNQIESVWSVLKSHIQKRYHSFYQYNLEAFLFEAL